MLFVLTALLAAMSCTALSQPMPCLLDTQCPDDFFCEYPTNVCRQCLDCQELNRSPPPNMTLHKCIKTDKDCGPCLEGWKPCPIYYDMGLGTTCEPVEKKRFLAEKEIIIWCVGACAAAVLLITVLYLHYFTLKDLYVFQSKIFKVEIPIKLTAIIEEPSVKVNY